MAVLYINPGQQVPLEFLSPHFKGQCHSCHQPTAAPKETINKSHNQEPDCKLNLPRLQVPLCLTGKQDDNSNLHAHKMHKNYLTNAINGEENRHMHYAHHN